MCKYCRWGLLYIRDLAPSPTCCGQRWRVLVSSLLSLTWARASLNTLTSLTWASVPDHSHTPDMKGVEAEEEEWHLTSSLAAAVTSSCRARTDSACSITNTHWHRSGGLFCEGKHQGHYTVLRCTVQCYDRSANTRLCSLYSREAPLIIGKPFFNFYIYSLK